LSKRLQHNPDLHVEASSYYLESCAVPVFQKCSVGWQDINSLVIILNIFSIV